MKRIKQFLNWKAIIVLSAVILGLLFIKRFLIKGSYAGNVEDLISALTSRGYMVSEVRENNLLKRFTISEMEKTLAINNKFSINVIVFSDTKTAAGALDLISENGNRIEHRYSHYAHRPHIYQSGEIIVMYVGNNLKMQWDLKNILGRQVKGSKWWEEPLAPLITKLYDIIDY